MGYRRNPNQLFKYLDDRTEGYLEPEHLEVLELGRSFCREDVIKSANEVIEKDLASLKKVLKERFGSLVAAWRQLFCTVSVEKQLTERVGLEEFVTRCRKVGFEGNFPKIWSELLLAGTNCVDLRAFALEYPVDDLDCGQLGANSLNPLEVLRRQSTRNHGPSANRIAIPDMGGHQHHRPSSGRVHHRPSHAAVVEKEARRVQIDALGGVLFSQLDPQVQGELEAFKKYCESKYASHDDTWRALLKECLESNFDAKLWKVEFLQAAHMIGYKGDALVIFEACDVDHEKCISEVDFRFVQIRSR
jgi:hypothetical protein